MTHPVNYWSYREDYTRNRVELLALIDEVLASGRLILGPRVEGFERNFAAYCGVAHGVGVNSGTDALFLALKALGVGPGDEVITVANTAVPTVAAIRATGAVPVFVDIEPDTFLMDVSHVDARVTARTRCLLPVHLYGQVADMEALGDLARRRRLAVLEDCAQAAGATRGGRKAGGFGDLAAFSFYPTKLLGGFGDGGMALTGSPEHAARLRRLRFYGMEKAYYSLEEGFNSRLDELQAALLDWKLAALDGDIAARRRLATLYDVGLREVGDVTTPRVAAGNEHAYYLYTIRTARRDALKAFLAERGIGTQVNYPWPVHVMPAYAFLGCREGSLPETERAAREILSLPLYPALAEDDVGRVIDGVRAFFSGRG